ncbi:response regulator [uncultured Desulfovibrio sp.]|uniref:response regulator n=1 Tax=uncultured Desulfovibrio sp. TaxID=167968 RepID=UPI002804AFAA|nr:response regulator [uncultured Desulfovibrio sp.]
MNLTSSGISRALLRACALFLCITCAGIGAPSTAHSGMIPPVLRSANTPLLPDLQYFIDVTGTMDVEEAAAPSNSQMFKPLNVKELPRVTGVMWLRFTLAPLPAGGRSQAMLLDIGPDVPADPVLYEPAANPATDSVEWREILPSHRNVMLLPEPGADPITCYIRLDGLPGIWFSPMLRSPQDAASNWGSLAGTAALLALAVVMLLCLLRGLSERGQWRIWTALYVGVALAQGIFGMPAYGSGSITLNQALAVLAPGLALMLLPHVGRHLMRTRGRSPLLDAQFILLSLPGAALALLPLLPGFSWSIRFLSLWPACTVIFTLSALGGAIMGLGGARRFLLGCLVPPLFVTAGVMGLDYGYAANLLASAPLWGTALSALLIAGTGLPRDAAQAEEGKKATKRESAAADKRNSAALDAALISSSLSAGPNDGPISLDTPLDDPNLRLLPPSAVTGKTAADFSALPVDISDNSDLEPVAAPARNQKKSASAVDPGMWENLLRPPLDRLMREGAALGHCSLPPAVRQYAENMLGAAGDLARIIDNPGKELDQTSVGEQRTAFNLQHLVREAHDAVTTAAENSGIGLAWYMPPLLGHMYEGQAKALRETLGLLLESAVRATTRGAVHLSVRRVPETADPGHLLFTVTDTGAGIPPRDRSSLALTRAWELAGSNSGYLNVECGPQGTSIAFTLRLKPLENETGTEATPEPQRAPTITVVAESAVDRQALAHMITTLGCNSTQARSMREALECNREAPALMLVAQYPHDGPAEADALGRFEAEALKVGLPVFKALAVTKDNTRWDELADTGYTHALLEPVDAEAFAATLREVLDEAGFTDHGPVVSAVSAPDPAAEESAPVPPAEDIPLPVHEVGSPEPENISVDAATSIQAQEQNQLPDLFGHDASLQNALPGTGASMDSQPLTLLSSTQSLNFGTADQSGMLLPMMEDSPQAEEDAPIELTDLLPPENSAQDAGQALAAMPDTPEISMEEPAAVIPAPADVAPAGAAPVEKEASPVEGLTAPEQAEPLDILPDAAQPEPLGMQDDAEPLPEEQPEIIAQILPEPSAQKPQEADSASPQQEPSQAANNTDAEFMASAGLEGPQWAAEAPAAPQTSEPEPEPARKSEAEDAAAQQENPASAPVEQAELVTGTPAVTPVPEATEQMSAPADKTPEALETLDWPEPEQHSDPTPAARETVTPAEFLEASLPSDPDMPEPAEQPAEQPAAESADPLKAMTGRAGEATLSPVNNAAFDVPAPAGKGAWDTYSLQDEWVGEPMPIGTPIKTASPASQSAPRPAQGFGQGFGQGLPQTPAREALSATAPTPPLAAPAREEKSYVSPSLAHPGEWVGEPMPMTKPARQDEASGTVDQSSKQDSGQADDERHSRQVEMPRTATGRLILKLLGSAGDRPLGADNEPLPGGKPDLMADLAAMPRQDDVQAESPALAGTPRAGSSAGVAEPQRSAAHLKGKATGNSIMNFIAGAAEALRHNGHDNAQHAPQGSHSGETAPAQAPEAVIHRAAPAEQRTVEPQPTVFAPQAPVQPIAPRETDQTIPQLVARLDAAMDDAQQGFKNRRCAVVGDAANRIATESDAFGFRVLARMARCVERAAKANDMNALRDLLPELAVAVERNRIGLTPRR